MERPGMSIDIEAAIDKILALEKKSETEERHIASALRDEEKPRKNRRGRPNVSDKIPIWAVSNEGVSSGRTIALISMCIKDGMNQSLSSLAERVSEMKGRPYGECLAVLRELRKKGKLGYYDDEFRLIKWKPGKENANVHRECENSGK